MQYSITIYFVKNVQSAAIKVPKPFCIFFKLKSQLRHREKKNCTVIVLAEPLKRISTQKIIVL